MIVGEHAEISIDLCYTIYTITQRTQQIASELEKISILDSRHGETFFLDSETLQTIRVIRAQFAQDMTKFHELLNQSCVYSGPKAKLPTIADAYHGIFLLQNLPDLIVNAENIKSALAKRATKAGEPISLKNMSISCTLFDTLTDWMDKNNKINLKLFVEKDPESENHVLRIETATPNKWFESQSCVVTKSEKIRGKTFPPASALDETLGSMIDAMGDLYEVTRNPFKYADHFFIQSTCGDLKIIPTRDNVFLPATDEFPYRGRLVTPKVRDGVFRCQVTEIGKDEQTQKSE